MVLALRCSPSSTCLPVYHAKRIVVPSCGTRLGSSPVPCFSRRPSPGSFQTQHQRRCLTRSSWEDVPVVTESDKRNTDLVKACNTVVRELSGMGMSREEVRLYFQLAVKRPRRCSPDFDLQRSAAAAATLLDQGGDGAGAGDETAQIADLEALQVVQLMLSDLWRWRRGGGGGDEENTTPDHVLALQEIQQVKVEEIDRMSSILLDKLPLGDQEKNEIGQAFQRVAGVAFESFVWGGIGFTVLALILFNFLRK